MKNHDSWSLKKQQKKDSLECAFYRKNLAPEVGVRNPNYCFIAYLTFVYVPSDARGLPSAQDEATLFDIENVGFRDLESDGLAVQVAAATRSGMKDFLFYTRDAQQFLARAETFRDAYPQFQVGCEVGPDPDWTHYDEFP